jgi:hypothetical protein
MDRLEPEGPLVLPLAMYGPVLLLPQLLGNKHRHKDRQTSGLRNYGDNN